MSKPTDDLLLKKLEDPESLSAEMKRLAAELKRLNNERNLIAAKFRTLLGIEENTNPEESPEIKTEAAVNLFGSTSFIGEVEGIYREKKKPVQILDAKQELSRRQGREISRKKVERAVHNLWHKGTLEKVGRGVYVIKNTA